jgi:ATP-dependent protease ClpP protease subunit
LSNCPVHQSKYPKKKAINYILIGAAISFVYSTATKIFDVNFWEPLVVMVIVVGSFFLYDLLQHNRDRYAFRRELYRQRMIFVGENYLDSQGGSMIMTQIKALNIKSTQRPIKLLINSPGGDADALRTVLNAIKASIAPIDGIVVGRAYSAAALMLQACRTRYALPFSVFMVHDPGVDFGFSVESPHLRRENLGAIENDFRENINKIRNRFANTESLCRSLLLQRTGMSVAEYQDIDEVALTVEQALEKNIIDKIVTTF